MCIKYECIIFLSFQLFFVAHLPMGLPLCSSPCFLKFHRCVHHYHCVNYISKTNQFPFFISHLSGVFWITNRVLCTAFNPVPLPSQFFQQPRWHTQEHTWLAIHEFRFFLESPRFQLDFSDVFIHPPPSWT